jgi:predicted murein hydrolase (TIGR00659 family)
MSPTVATGTMLWLPVTLAIYFAASEIYRISGKEALLNPTLLTIAALCAVLVTFNVRYTAYFEAVRILHYLLGTAVVALAIPLHRNLQRLMRDWRAITVALIAGSLTSIVSGLMIARALGASPSTLLSIAPKSATTAVSMEIARGIGGIPAVTAALTILTGIIGAVLGPYILTWCGVDSPAARGVALGTASHGIATARAFSECERAGCSASLAMGINAVLTALLVPMIVSAVQMPK